MTEEFSLHQALKLTRDGDHWGGVIRPGWDVFGIPHGGYVMAMAANAALHEAGEPDLFSVTTHFLKKCDHGPIRWVAREATRSRRLRSISVDGIQNDGVVVTTLALVGDRTAYDGERWHARHPPPLDDIEAAPDPRGPDIARLLGVRMSRSSLGYTRGEMSDEARMVASIEPPEATTTDQLLALVACDGGPPAVWNALGMSGWVPTIELTAQIRARPAQGPLTLVASTASVSGGFLEEDAEIYDAEGQLIALSRQLARWRS